MTVDNCFECRYLIRNAGKLVISYHCRKKKEDIMSINYLKLSCIYGKIRTMSIIDRIRIRLIRFKDREMKR